MTTRVAYLVKRFPRLSETFVLNEYLEVRRQGLDVVLYALLDPEERVVHPAAGTLKAEVIYLNLAGAAGRSRLRLLAGAVARGLRHPAGLARVAWALLTVHRSMPSVRHAFEGLWLARDLERRGVTHLHAHWAHSPAAVAYFTRLAGGPPFSFTAHAKDLYTTLPRNLRLRAAAAEFVITCTEANRRYLDEVLGSGHGVAVHVIRHGTDLVRFQAADRRPEPHLIVSVGRLVPKKGFDVLLQALGLLRTVGVELRCEVFGGGPLRADLESLAAELGLEGIVAFHGARPIDEIQAAYRRAALFALSPLVTADGDRDGIPNVLVEAMAAGVPVVSTRMSGIPELIDSEQDGLLVEPSDAQALAAAIRRLLADRELASRLALAGRHKVERDFDMTVNAGRVLALLAGANQSAEARPERVPA